MSKAIDISVQEYLDLIGVKYGVYGGREIDRDGWLCDEWSVMFTRQGKSTLTEKFYTGTGHRKVVSMRGTRHERFIAIKPEAANVLSSFLLDAQAGEENFLDFCDNFGYDPDSKEHTRVYETCCKLNQAVRQFFSNTERKHLQELLQDY